MKELEIFLHHLNRLVQLPVIKVIAGIFLWILQAFFGSTFRAAYQILFILWVMDTATGYYHARANPAIVPESRKMYHGLVKISVYALLMMIGYQCSRLEITAFVQNIIESAVILTESYSILENVQKIAMLKGVNIPIINQIMAIVQGKINKIDGGKQ